jgi:xyloglucan-specific exo-beta-1,4-glucanase
MKKITHITCYFLLLQVSVTAQVNWKNASTQGMGYVSGIIIHPNTYVKYVRTDVSGMFRFDDVTKKWSNLLDNIIRVDQKDIACVETFAVDTKTSGTNQVLYALGGNGIKSYMMKSVNDGQSWTINQGWYTDSIKAFGNGDWRCAGERMAIDPKNSNVVYCGTRLNGLWKTTNAAGQWNKVTAFTATGGAGGLGTPGGISFVVFDSSSTITVNSQVVSKNIYIGLIDGGVYRSNNGGVSWCYLANGFNAALYNPVRAIFSNNKLIVPLIGDGDTDGEVWQFVPSATNCSGVWTNKTPGIQNYNACPFYGRYKYNAVAVRPGFPNTVYVASRQMTPRKIFYTENFNATYPTWKILTVETDNYGGTCAAQYQKSVYTAPVSFTNLTGYDWVGNIAFDPTNNKRLWMTNGNGVIIADDITAGTVNISAVNTMKNFEMLCVNDMASPPLPNTTPLVTAALDIMGIVYSNLDNGVVKKIDPSFGLSAGISIAYSFKNPKVMAVLGQDYYNPADIKRTLKSTDGGITWKSFWNKPPGCTDAPWGGNIAISATNANNMIWVPAFVGVTDSCQDTVKNQPRYTMNGGTTWLFCNNINFPGGNFNLQEGSFGTGKALESDKVNGNKFYYFAMPGTTFSTQLWRTTNGGANWVKMSEGTLPISGKAQLKANPFKEDDIWFAPFNQYILETDPAPALRKLWHSTNGGANWTSLTSMDAVYAFGFGMKKTGSANASLIVYGKKNNVESIYISYDLGVTFTNLGTQNIPEGIITNIEGDMKVQNRIYAATGCRGVWYGDVPVTLLAAAATCGNIIIAPNPSKGFFSLQLPQRFKNNTGQITIIDMLGRTVKNIKLSDILQPINISGIARGTYTVQVISNEKNYTARLVVE